MNNRINDLKQKNIIITEYIVGQPDYQRGLEHSKSEDILDVVEKLRDSAGLFETEVYVVTNAELNMVKQNLHIVHGEIDEKFKKLSLYFQRWNLALNFLVEHPEISNAALLDIGDTKMIKNPFLEIKEGFVYVGDEIFDLSSYIVNESDTPEFINEFVKKFNYLQLLNPGVLVGSRSILIEVLVSFMYVVNKSMINGSKIGNFEMATFNYVLYNYFSGRVIHGRKVTSKFLFDDNSTRNWFKHK